MYKKISILTIITISLICLMSFKGFTEVYAEDRQEFYVSPNGNDLFVGSEAQPFASLERARGAIRELRNTTGLPTGGVIVYLRGGEYSLTETFVLTPEDSGEEGSPIVYTAFPGEKPIISGGRDINGWTQLIDPILGVANEAEGKLWVANIDQNWKPHFLYVNGDSKQVARKYNTDEWDTVV